MLESAGVVAPERIACGSYNASAGQEAIVDALECFRAARSAGRSVELSVNYCIDCKDTSTFIWTPDRGTLHAHVQFSITARVSRVETCSDVAFRAIPSDVVEHLTCIDPAPVFACEGRVARSQA